MKGLNQFVRFDLGAFLDGKTLAVVGVKPWTDFDTKAVLGTSVETVIISDRTSYRTRGDEQITNRFEKLTLKVSRVNLPVELDARVLPAGEATATVYGEFRNQLSVKCADLQVLDPPQKKAA